LNVCLKLAESSLLLIKIISISGSKMSEAAQQRSEGGDQAISPTQREPTLKSPSATGEDDWRPVALRLIEDDVVRKSAEPKIFVHQDPFFDSNSTVVMEIRNRVY
jgi:hypothetical protein